MRGRAGQGMHARTLVMVWMYQAVDGAKRSAEDATRWTRSARRKASLLFSRNSSSWGGGGGGGLYVFDEGKEGGSTTRAHWLAFRGDT